MKCISCESEINPQWGHAIEQNICPFCGKSILEEHLKKLLSVLRDTMEQLSPSYQEQLDDWLLSNHNYVKTDSPDLIKYLPKDLLLELGKEKMKEKADREFQEKKTYTVKVQTEEGVQEVQAEKVQSEERTNEFFKRAEVIRTPNTSAAKSTDAPPVFASLAEKTAHHKEMVKQIKKAGSQGITMGGGSMMLPAEMLEQADPEAVAEFQSMISGGEVASSLSDSGDDEVPSHILAMNQKLAASAKGGGHSAANAADLLKLQQMQERVAQSRANFESGESRAKKGGFSRAG